MAITYTWNCHTVDVYPSEGGEQNVIYNIHWILTGTDSEVDAEGNPYVATVYSTQTVDTSDLSNFVPFDQVTNTIATGWVEAAMGAEEVQSLKDGLDAQIDGLKNPTSVTKTLVS
jgi:hypothetical protein